MNSSSSVATARPSTNSHNVIAQSFSRYGPGADSLMGRTEGASRDDKWAAIVSSRSRLPWEKSNEVPDAIGATIGQGVNLTVVGFPRCKTSGVTTPSPALAPATVDA